MKIYIGNEVNNKVSLFNPEKKDLLLQTLNTLEKIDDFNKIPNLKRIKDSNLFEIKSKDLRLFFVRENDNLIIVDLVINETSHNVTPIAAYRINPKFNNEYNPIFNHNINPTFNHNINPIFNHNINPIFNHNINPTFNHNINPTFNHNINPIFNHSINPVFNHSINPVFNSMINPFRNSLFQCSLLFDNNNNSLGFGIVVNNDCEIFYSNDLKVKFYCFSINEISRICFENNKLYGYIVKANDNFSLLYQNNEHIMNIIK